MTLTFSPESVVLCDERANGNRRHVWASRGPNGGLIVSGQTLGDANTIMGYTEYEWTLSVAAADIGKLMKALGLWHMPWQRDARLLRALARRFSGPRASKIELFLKEHGIPYSLWNRVGD